MTTSRPLRALSVALDAQGYRAHRACCRVRRPWKCVAEEIAPDLVVLDLASPASTASR
ncbi:MAG: hypothetical protein U0Y82_15605 [Thermoleophilia bacterium]